MLEIALKLHQNTHTNSSERNQDYYSFSINLAQLWRLDNSKEAQISGGRMISFLENKKGPWKFGNKLWSLPLFHYRKLILLIGRLNFYVFINHI